MYELAADTFDFDASLAIDADLYIRDTEEAGTGIDKTTVLSVTIDDVKTIRIRIDWFNLSSSETTFKTLLVPETGYLFFGARFFRGMIDLNDCAILEKEKCIQFWDFFRIKNTIVVLTELEALALNLKGDTIHRIPLDPPFEFEKQENGILFQSPVYGEQLLKLE